jgi:hypothetical protein
MLHAFQSKRSSAHCVHHNSVVANLPAPNSQPTKFVSISNHSSPKVASKLILKRQFKSKFISSPPLGRDSHHDASLFNSFFIPSTFLLLFCRFIKNFPFAKMSNLNLQQHRPSLIVSSIGPFKC